MSGHVLLVDDDQDMCRLLATGLGQKGFAVTWRTSAGEALEVVERVEVDVVVTDLDMQGTNGIELCARIAANRPDLPVAVLTAYGSFEAAVAAMRAGAVDFITKPTALDVLAATVSRAVDERALRARVTRLPHAAEPPGRGVLLTASPGMQRVLDLVDRVVDSDATVLIAGESGTGKELIARALHGRGRRRGGPFVGINCAAVPEALLESELFGHTSGAFTGARGPRAGLFAQADGGVLFLDEIAELPLALQPKLLRALQERKVRPVGADVEVPFDARIVAATNTNLEAAVADGRFRQELYFRIDVVRIDLPPLRERRDDVLLLAQECLERCAQQAGKAVAGLSPAVARRLVEYAWPGNVRELQNCIERAVAVARYDQLAVDDLPERMRALPGTPLLPGHPDGGALPSMAEVEQRHIRRVLDQVKGNRRLAARILGLDRKTLYRKLLRYDTRS